MNRSVLVQWLDTWTLYHVIIRSILPSFPTSSFGQTFFQTSFARFHIRRLSLRDYSPGSYLFISYSANVN
jgi:hypothetical protein